MTERIRELLLEQKVGVRLTTDALARRLKVGVQSVHKSAKDPSLAKFREGVQGSPVQWGHPDTFSTHEPEEDQLALSRKAVATLTSENSKLRLRLASLRNEVESVAGALTPVSPLKLIPLKKSKKPRQVAVLSLADWHLGERVSPSQTGGFGYDHDVARAGMLDITRRFLQWVETQRAGYDIRELVIFSLGDLVSGAIHPELIRTNSLPTTVAVAKAAELLAEVVSSLAPHFSKVRVVEVSADNHGRLDDKPPSKGASSENWCYLVHSMANALLSKHSNVEAILCEDPMPVVSVGGHEVLALHGHQVRGGGGGSPYNGISRHFARVLAARYDQGLPPLLCIIMGHWHHHAVLEGRVVLAPSLIGPSEYSIQRGLHSKPGQLAFLVGSNGFHCMTVLERR